MAVRKVSSRSIISNNYSPTPYRNMILNSDIDRVALLPDDVVVILEKIETLYTNNMATLHYDLIPGNYIELMQLYNIILTSYRNTNNSTLKLLLKITGEALISSMNTFGLFQSNNQLNTEIIVLNQKINQLEHPVITENISVSSGNLSLTKTFTLAPIFSIYISLYGMPKQGVGFDPNRMSDLLVILEKNGIDPYN